MVDRERTCPLLLRTFLNKGGHRRSVCMRTLSSSRHIGASPLSVTVRQEDYAVRGKEPVDDEVQVYSWMDATLRELSDLIKEASPAARDRNSQLSFAIVYPGAPLQPCTQRALHSLAQSYTHAWLSSRAADGRSLADKRGTMTLKEVGVTHALRRGMDDEKTLSMLHFQTGDFLDCAILS